MARVKLNLPEEFHFSTEIPIRIDDLSYGAHLGHDSILPFAHEARVRFLGHLGYDEKDIEGLSYIMGNQIALVKTGMVFYDYRKDKISRVPERFKTRTTVKEG